VSNLTTFELKIAGPREVVTWSNSTNFDGKDHKDPCHQSQPHLQGKYHRKRCILASSGTPACHPRPRRSTHTAGRISLKVDHDCSLTKSGATALGSDDAWSAISGLDGHSFENEDVGDSDGVTDLIVDDVPEPCSESLFRQGVVQPPGSHSYSASKAATSIDPRPRPKRDVSCLGCQRRDTESSIGLEISCY
jgi:hypothetical protein